MKKNNRAIYGILLLVLTFFIILVIFATYTVNVIKTDMDSSFSPNKSGSIAVIEIEGIILKAKKVVELLLKAEKDKDIKAIILRINSPGGAVGPTQEIYEEIRRIDGQYDPKNPKESKGKPIYASFGAIAASGGYYIGAATRKIYSSPGTLTGSIGVIMQFYDLSELYNLAKVKTETLKAGKYKDLGHPHRSMTNEERDLMEKMVKGVHKQFINDILRLRKDRLKYDIWELAQGQVFSGEDALKYGLIDELGSLWSAGRKIHKDLKLEGDFEFKYIKKKKKINWLELISNIENSLSEFNLSSWTHNIPFFIYKP